VLVAADDLRLPGRTRSEVRLVDAASGKVRGSALRGIFAASHLAVSPDGKYLALDASQGSLGYPLQVVDLATGRGQRLEGHTGAITGLVFADGRTLISAGRDATVRFWQVSSGRELLSIPQGKAAEALDFSAAGQVLAVGSRHGRHGQVRLLRAAGEGPIYRALTPPGPGEHPRWVREFDGGQGIQEEAYFDEKGAAARSPLGYHLKVIRFIPPSQIVETAYFDDKGRPGRHQGGYHRLVPTYDARGRLIEEAFFDESGKLVRPRVGAARTRYRYDEQGKQHVEAHLDSDGTPLVWQVRIVAVVAGQPGAKAGLRGGDVVVRYDGKEVTSVAAFIALRKAEKPDGKPRRLIVRRDGKLLDLAVLPGLLGVNLEGQLERRPK
jgi:hypothetical protein